MEPTERPPTMPATICQNCAQSLHYCDTSLYAENTPCCNMCEHPR